SPSSRPARVFPKREVTVPLRRVVALCASFAFLVLLPVRSSQAALCDGISDASDTPLTTVRIASGLLRPLLVTAPPGDTSRLFILEQDGTIRIVKNGVLLATPFLDISALTRSPSDGGGDEQGLLGLAFHPDYANNGLLFVFHTDTAGANNLLARYA